MTDSKLTIRVSHNLVEGARRYARQNHTTVTRLVSEFLRHLTNQSDFLDDAPMVKRLSGILTENISVEDYKKYIDKKYENGEKIKWKPSNQKAWVFPASGWGASTGSCSSTWMRRSWPV